MHDHTDQPVPWRHRRLTGGRARELLTLDDPEYGRHFSEAEWDGVAERLAALARLIWQVHCNEMSDRAAAPEKVEEPSQREQAPAQETR